MKLKKINRGFLLFSVLLIGVVVYLLIHSAGQKKLKSDLTEIYKTYLEGEAAFLVTTEENVFDRDGCEKALSPYFSKQSDTLPKVISLLEKSAIARSEQDPIERFTTFEKQILSNEPELTTEKNYARLSLYVKFTFGTDGKIMVENRRVNILFIKENGAWKLALPDGYTPLNIYDYDISFDNDYENAVELYGYPLGKEVIQ